MRAVVTAVAVTAVAVGLAVAGCGPTNGVNPDNRPPRAEVERLEVSLERVVVRDVSTDPDGDLLTRRWSLRTHSGDARLTEDGDTATLEALTPGSWDLVLEVSDGLLTDEYYGTMRVDDRVVALEIWTDYPAKALIPLEVRVDATHEPLQWHWRAHPRDGVVFDDPSSSRTKVTFPSGGNYEIVVEALFDGFLLAARDRVYVEPLPPAPALTPGPDLVVEVGSFVTTEAECENGELSYAVADAPAGAAPVLERVPNPFRYSEITTVRFTPDREGPYRLDWSCSDEIGRVASASTSIESYAAGAGPGILDPDQVYVRYRVGSYGTRLVEPRAGTALAWLPGFSPILGSDGRVVYIADSAAHLWMPETRDPDAWPHLPEANDPPLHLPGCHGVKTLAPLPGGGILPMCDDGWVVDGVPLGADFGRGRLVAVQEGPVFLFQDDDPLSTEDAIILQAPGREPVVLNGDLHAARPAADGGFVILQGETVAHLDLEGNVTPLWVLAERPPGSGVWERILDGEGAVWERMSGGDLLRRTADSVQLFPGADVHYSDILLLSGTTPVEVTP